MSAGLVPLLQASVAQTPDALAVIHGERRVSYAQLWRQVGAVAGFLRAHKLAVGARVALLMDNSPAYIAAYYGVLAAGGVVVALNAATKSRDLSNWLGHSGASWLIADGAHPELAAVAAARAREELRIVAVGASAVSDAIAWDEVLATPAQAPLGADPEAPAAIIYTSGTTGKPKGVTLSHRNLAANVKSILTYLELSGADRALNVLPFYYSYGNSVLHTHLAVGGSLVLENSMMFPHKVMERLAAERATGFAGVPSTYALLLNRVRFQDYDLSSLRYMTQAGGAMPTTNIARLHAALPQVALFVMYGQTEATARLTYLPPARLEEKLGSAGRAIPGVTLEIRDEHGRPMPSGTVGEIYARGDNIMRGYWNDADTTAQVLRDGWLKTGDLARMDEDGFIFIEGRLSDMIKSGAHRINPKEIEEVIAEVDGVAEVAVVGVPDDILGQTIRAVIVPQPGAALVPRAIQAHCHKQLALYKIPKLIDFASELPKTASGKVKRYLLSAKQ